jgi:hypothetical protein
MKQSESKNQLKLETYDAGSIDSLARQRGLQADYEKFQKPIKAQTEDKIE